jgi:hypothetical protein
MVLRSVSVLWDTHRSMEDSESFLGFATEGYERGDFGGWGGHVLRAEPRAYRAILAPLVEPCVWGIAAVR